MTSTSTNNLVGSLIAATDVRVGDVRARDVAEDIIGLKNFGQRSDAVLDAQRRLEAFGGVVGLWVGVLQPRLSRLLPAGHILEIGCGPGLLGSMLRGHARMYTGVDVCERSLARARERLGSGEGVRLVLGDGRSLAGVQASSVDLCVSFDALVHAERATVGAYLRELGQKLVPGGMALLHTSNLGEHVEELQAATGRIDMQSPIVAGRHPSMTGEALIQDAADVGLRVIAQELFGVTDHGLFTDALSLVCRDAGAVGEMGARVQTAVVRRHDWGLVCAECRRLASLYRPVAPVL